jgi:hypothetical protein
MTKKRFQASLQTKVHGDIKCGMSLCNKTLQICKLHILQ